MQSTPSLLVLIGQCSLFTCLLYEYHLIKDNKTWNEAQKFCREKYTDLATVSNMTDMERLWNSTENQDEAWIGLYSYPGKDNRKWFWSRPGMDFIGSQTRWIKGEPNDGGGNIENCGAMINSVWFDDKCSAKWKVFCFMESKQSTNTFHYINTLLTWPQAQSYCRQYYTDLISGLDQLDDPNVAYKSSAWIGLFRDTWRWSDGSNSSFRNWEYVEDLVDGQSNKTCATVVNRTGKWSLDYCDQQKPFYCYEAPKRKHMVRLKINFVNPSVNIKDPAIIESMLKQMEQKFGDKGTFVKLSWMKLPEIENKTKEEQTESQCPI